MDDLNGLHPPHVTRPILDSARAIGFEMSCEEKTGALLRVLAASRPGARILELGTGAGVSTAWLLDGMDTAATLLSVESDERVAAIAQAHLGNDARLRLLIGDGERLLHELQGQFFDLIFADTWPGKFYALEHCIALLPRGGLYLIDDLLPQANWPDGHAPKVAQLIATMSAHPALRIVKLNWASGLILATRR